MTVRSKGGRSSRFGVVLTFLLLLPAGGALADSCGQRVAPPSLSVRSLVQPPKQDLTRSIKDLTGDPNVAVPRGLENFGFAVGATAAAPKTEYSWSTQGAQMPDGTWCWRAAKVSVIVTVATTVYIAKEIPRESCLWREVAKHEAKHVRLDRQLFPSLPGIVRPKVQRVIAHSVSAGTIEEASALLGRRIDAAVVEAAAFFELTRNKRQLEIDTVEEYGRPNRICGNAEVAAAIRRAGLQ